ncbi:MAG: Gfo/Idh/MocA family oxidoreductase [Armatimonadetes bacterium]|nr:Gfo/Idh/MocA family oxidoreductase [Armatimonadota bacterium]CUU37151.1 Predicted dehydrogenase [Armatimonadetes bacterium DC]
MASRLRIGIVGSGFVARFHAQAFVNVRDAEITAIASRNEKSASELAQLCQTLGVGSPKVFTDVRAMARDESVDAIWFLAPNYVRVELIEAIADEVRSGRAALKGLAVEKPLARNLAEARRVLQAVEEAGIPHGYLENQLFAPSVVRGKELLWRRGASIAGEPYLARCAEEHSGPHRAWFWRGDLQGGGVLNDMMCHSVAAGWFVLTPPSLPLEALKPRSVTAQIACLKWARPEYAQKLRDAYAHEMEVDYVNHPAEDYASAKIVFETPSGNLALVEATTSWCFVGPGLRLTFEVLGPEYMLAINTLAGEGTIFFSRNVQGAAGEDIVEKQNAEQGLMPYLADEVHSYGYIAENRYFTECFLKGETPFCTLEYGVRITELLMAAYLSAERRQTVDLPCPELEQFVPAVAQGTWNPKMI